MKKRQTTLKFESLEDRALLAVTAGVDLPADTAPAEIASTEAGILAVPKIITGKNGVFASRGLNNHQIEWTAVGNASGYELAYSADGVQWNSVLTSATGSLVRNLSYGDLERYRVRAIGTGGYADSNWSDVTSVMVCPSDIDGDGFIGPGDASYVSSAWFSMEGDENWNPACDIDGDGFIGPGDYSLISSGWFCTPDEVEITSLGLAFDGTSVNLVDVTGTGEKVIRSGDRISFRMAGGEYGTPITMTKSASSLGIASFLAPGSYTVQVRVERPGISHEWTGTISFEIEEPEPEPDPDPVPIRIVSFNVRACRGLNSSSGVSVERVSAVLNDLAPDVAGLQEIDYKTSRTGYVDQITVLGQQTDMYSYFAKTINFGGGQYGIGALAKTEPISVKRVSLPGADEARVLLELEFEDFVLFDTHLSLTASSRAASAPIIKEELYKYSKPVVLLGDMNISSMTEVNNLFGDTWTVISPNQPTFPADNPTSRIDYILIADPTGAISVGSQVWKDAVISSGVVNVQASDHRPVYIDIVFPAR